MFYPMRGMEFCSRLPPYRGANILGAISEFVRHVPGPKVHDRDVVAIVEICRDCAAGAGQRGCRAPWIFLRPPGAAGARSPHIMAVPRARTVTARRALSTPPEPFAIWVLQDSELTATGDAILRDGSHLYDLHLEPDRLFQTETWSALDSRIIKEVAAFVSENDPGTSPGRLSQVARKVAGTKLEALLTHLVTHLPEGGSRESLRTQLIRIGLHMPGRTTARSKKASADSNRDCS
jgi:hypothetical protein